MSSPQPETQLPSKFFKKEKLSLSKSLEASFLLIIQQNFQQAVSFKIKEKYEVNYSKAGMV